MCQCLLKTFFPLFRHVRKISSKFRFFLLLLLALPPNEWIWSKRRCEEWWKSFSFIHTYEFGHRRWTAFSVVAWSILQRIINGQQPIICFLFSFCGENVFLYAKTFSYNTAPPLAFCIASCVNEAVEPSRQNSRVLLDRYGTKAKSHFEVLNDREWQDNLEMPETRISRSHSVLKRQTFEFFDAI